MERFLVALVQADTLLAVFVRGLYATAAHIIRIYDGRDQFQLCTVFRHWRTCQFKDQFIGQVENQHTIMPATFFIVWPTDGQLSGWTHIHMGFAHPTALVIWQLW